MRNDTTLGMAMVDSINNSLPRDPIHQQILAGTLASRKAAIETAKRHGTKLVIWDNGIKEVSPYANR